MQPRIKIRGIYSTALTHFAQDSGFEVVDPSPKIRERFHMDFPDGDFDILIQDREDLQGIELKGEADQLCNFLVLMQKVFLDAIIVSFLPTDDNEPIVVANMELPGGSKKNMDLIRSRVVPTLKNHHRLKIIDSNLLDSAEIELEKHPENKAEIEERILLEGIIHPMIREGLVRLEHIRPSGKSMRPREGSVQEVVDNKIIFKRSFSKGHYDGLNLPIRRGDYCLTEIREGEWYVKHSYFSKEHLLIGEYFNINTPVEFYPYGARYVDLEVDVIRRAGEDAFAIDREKLEILAKKGCIGEDLQARALFVAEQMLRSLNRENLPDRAER